MSRAWHCDRDGCDTWTRAGYRHGFVKVEAGSGPPLHFCGWDCVLSYSAAKEPTTVVTARR